MLAHEDRKERGLIRVLRDFGRAGAWRLTLVALPFVLLSACQSEEEEKEGGGFAFLDVAYLEPPPESSSSPSPQPTITITPKPSVSPSAPPPPPISIKDFTPTDSTVVMTDALSKTFSINVETTLPLTYTYYLDGTKLAAASGSYHVLKGSDLSAGAHTLKVDVTDGLTNASKSFSIRKNRPPSVTGSSPATTGNSINYTSNKTFTVTTIDVDGDAMTFAWKLNSATAATLFSVSSTSNGSTAIFTPTISQVGANTISVEIYDGYETTTYAWSLDVVNPVVASISSYSPTTAPVIITATGSANFAISATGKDPLAYTWTLDGTAVSGASTSMFTLSGASLSVGDHTLVARVADNTSSATQNFTVRRNAPPTFSNPTPTSTPIRMNYQTTAAFSIRATDSNPDTLNFTWMLDGASSSTMASVVSATTTGMTFTPTVAQIGARTIEARVTDGTESVTYSWPVEVNYFTTFANTLAAGSIATLAGNPSAGDGLTPTADQSAIKIQPTWVIDDGSGNLFISDDGNHTVWFFNRSGGTKTLLGKIVAAGKLAAIAGNGAAGKTNESDTNLNFKLNTPLGLAWDSTGNDLYIADSGNNRVVRIDQDGVGTTVFGTGGTTQGGATNTDGGAGTTHVCGGATDLAILASNNSLYVSCPTTFTIKRMTLDTNLGYVVVGAIAAGSASAGYVNGTAGAGGASKVRAPRGIDFDAQGNLYWVDGPTAGCTVRVHLSGGVNKAFFGAGAITANQTGYLSGLDGTCATNTQNTTVANARYYQPRDVVVLRNAGDTDVDGIFVVASVGNTVMFLNNTGGNLTYGNRAVPSNSADRVFGTNTAGFAENKGYTAQTSSPQGAWIDATKTTLYVADRGNFRIRIMDLALSTGQTSTLLGEGKYRNGYISDTATTATAVYMNQPTHLAYDNTGKKLYYSDSVNARVKAINMVSGEVTTAVGRGNAGNGYIEAEDPTLVYMKSPRGLALYGSALIYADQSSSNCLVRAWNTSAAPITIFGVTIPANSVSTVAGLAGAGTCGVYAGEGGAATLATINTPEGIATDGTNLFIADSGNDCIYKVSNTGTITKHVGTCGTASNLDGNMAAIDEKLNNPTEIQVDPSNTSNLFIVDQTNQATHRVKYANFTAGAITIGSTNVPAGFISTIYSTTGTPFFYGFAAMENQVCFGGGNNTGASGAHNIYCKDRNSALNNTTMRVGPDQATDLTLGGAPLGTEQEAILTVNARVQQPYGMVFDASGNLYFADRLNHIIRYVKKWW